jgi:hypothetical protein
LYIDERPALFDFLLVHQNVPGKDKSLCPFPRLRQPSLDQEQVKTNSLQSVAYHVSAPGLGVEYRPRPPQKPLS